jgi:lipoprotein-anchoring transpeptidase ErfK/SrfK
MLHALSTANFTRALAAACSFCISGLVTEGEARDQTAAFIVHGTPRTCSAITQLDSALSSRYQAFFAGWTEQDYADAVAWAEACSDYGWHVPGQPRVPLLHAQHDKTLGPAPSPTMSSAVFAAAVTHPIVRAEVLARPRMKWSALHELPSDGSAVIGFDAAITSHYADTLPDIARRFDLGYEEIVRANPGVDIWLPGEGTRILLPGRHPVPPGSREGVVVNLAEQRLYYFPKPRQNEKPMVITYPVSIGKMGESTPLGQTVITAKVERPSWYPPASVRKEHAERGDLLPAVVGPGSDNPLGEFMMRLGFGDGSYEIHGTNRPVSIGMATTNGCIGMYPEDVAALFKLVGVGTPVRLINVPVNARNLTR